MPRFCYDLPSLVRLPPRPSTSHLTLGQPYDAGHHSVMLAHDGPLWQIQPRQPHRSQHSSGSMHPRSDHLLPSTVRDRLSNGGMPCQRGQFRLVSTLFTTSPRKGKAQRIGLSPTEDSGINDAVTTLVPGLLSRGALTDKAAKRNQRRFRAEHHLSSQRC